jgi:hypothetical protein
VLVRDRLIMTYGYWPMHRDQPLLLPPDLRELHDIIAHHISVAALQAGAARMLAESSAPPRFRTHGSGRSNPGLTLQLTTRSASWPASQELTAEPPVATNGRSQGTRGRRIA